MKLFKKLIKIKGRNNQLLSPRNKGNRFYDRSPVKIIGDNNRIDIHPDNKFYKLELIISGSNNRISIGEGCWGSLKIIINTDNAEVRIGKGCAFRGLECGLWEKGSSLIIGDEVMAARDSRMYVSDFHAIVDRQTMQPINQGKNITIGNHVWIGERAMILKNNKIADDVIVAAGAIVTKNLDESHTIYAGNPAKAVKHGVTWFEEKYDAYPARKTELNI